MKMKILKNILLRAVPTLSLYIYKINVARFEIFYLSKYLPTIFMTNFIDFSKILDFMIIKIEFIFLPSYQAPFHTLEVYNFLYFCTYVLYITLKSLSE